MDFDFLQLHDALKYQNKKYSAQQEKAVITMQKFYRGYYVRRHVYPSLMFLYLSGQLDMSPAEMNHDELRYLIRAVPKSSSKVVVISELTAGIFNLNEQNRRQVADIRDKLHFVRQKLIGGTQCIYTGLWDKVTNQREGYGVQLWPDGARYEGQWKNDQAAGQGRFILADGDYYVGEWANDKANGKGNYVYLGGTIYQGEWQDDRFHGQGEERFTDGSYYRGSYEEGLKKGQGFFKWEDGATYMGSWRANKMHGRGTFIWKDGRKYIGEYQNDLKHGCGTFFWLDGRTYEGGWFKGKMDGVGKIIGNRNMLSNS